VEGDQVGGPSHQSATNSSSRQPRYARGRLVQAASRSSNGGRLRRSWPPGLSSRTPSRIWPPSPGSGWRDGSCTRRRSGSTTDRVCTRSLPGSGPGCCASRSATRARRCARRRALRVAHGAAVGGPRWRLRRVHGARMAPTDPSVAPGGNGAPRPDALRACPLRVLDRGGGCNGVLGRRDARISTVEAVLGRRDRVIRRGVDAAIEIPTLEGRVR
jgi:hypothetical protein